jgi:tetratricopeptide (TPR) repeat protein
MRGFGTGFAALLFLHLLFSVSMSALSARSSSSGLADQIKMALTLHKSGANSDALLAYDEVLQIDGLGNSVASTIQSNRGAIFMQAGQYEMARDAFSAAVLLQPDNINAQFNLAVTLTSKLGEHLKAIRHCAAVLRLDKRHVKALHLMGNILQGLGRQEDADRYIAQAAAESAALEESAEFVPSSSAKISLAWGQWDASLHRIAIARVGDAMSYTHSDGKQYTLHCISESPRIFRIENLLTSVECAAIVDRAKSHLEYSFVTGGGGDGASGYRTSANAWLSKDELLNDVNRRLAGLLGLEPATSIALQPAAEELQVVRYKAGGLFKPHCDSSKFHPRVLTLLFYLNDVSGSDESITGGGTWFPFSSGGAGRKALDSASISSVEQAVQSALDSYETGAEEEKQKRGEGLKTGLVVVPKPGSAILFFNHLPTGELDPLSVHAGLPVGSGSGSESESGAEDGGADPIEKWAANFWFGGISKSS